MTEATGHARAGQRTEARVSRKPLSATAGPAAAQGKVNRRIEISATITEAIADALENARDLPKEVSNVA